MTILLDHTILLMVAVAKCRMNVTSIAVVVAEASHHCRCARTVKTSLGMLAGIMTAHLATSILVAMILLCCASSTATAAGIKELGSIQGKSGSAMGQFPSRFVNHEVCRVNDEAINSYGCKPCHIELMIFFLQPLSVSWKYLALAGILQEQTLDHSMFSESG